MSRFEAACAAGIVAMMTVAGVTSNGGLMAVALAAGIGLLGVLLLQEVGPRDDASPRDRDAEPCPRCAGLGKDAYTLLPCPRCHGTGWVRTR